MSWETMITNVGFPIALCIYFVVKIEKVVKNNTIALTRFIEMTKKQR